MNKRYYAGCLLLTTIFATINIGASQEISTLFLEPGSCYYPVSLDNPHVQVDSDPDFRHNPSMSYDANIGNDLSREYGPERYLKWCYNSMALPVQADS